MSTDTTQADSSAQLLKPAWLPFRILGRIFDFLWFLLTTAALLWFFVSTSVYFRNQLTAPPEPDIDMQNNVQSAHSQTTLIARQALAFYQNSLSTVGSPLNPDCSPATPNACWPQNLDELIQSSYLDDGFRNSAFGLPVTATPDGDEFAIRVPTPSLEANQMLAELFGNRLIIDNVDDQAPSITLVIQRPGR